MVATGQEMVRGNILRGQGIPLKVKEKLLPQEKLGKVKF